MDVSERPRIRAISAYGSPCFARSMNAVRSHSRILPRAFSIRFSSCLYSVNLSGPGFRALHDQLPDHLKGFVTFAYRTGWRLSEITRLTWNQIDRSDWTVRLEVGETKNKDGRLIYLDDKLRRIIHHRYIDRHLGCPYVFHRAGREIRDIRGTWKRACKAIGLEGRIFHDLRRTAIRNMIRAGIPERVAMQISGHKTRSVFDRYNIVSPEDLKIAAEKQASYLQVL